MLDVRRVVVVDVGSADGARTDQPLDLGLIDAGVLSNPVEPCLVQQAAGNHGGREVLLSVSGRRHDRYAREEPKGTLMFTPCSHECARVTFVDPREQQAGPDLGERCPSAI